MKSIYITRRLPEHILQQLIDNGISYEMHEEDRRVPKDIFMEKVAGKWGILIISENKIDEDIVNAAGQNLKVVSTISVGFDHIDMTLLKERQIKVGYTPDILTDAAADFTMALVLATSRRFIEGHAAVRDGSWSQWHYSWLCGRQMAGKTVGIVGMGRIGQAVARRLIPFQITHILYNNRRGKAGDEVDLSHTTEGTAFSVKGVAQWAPWENLLSQSDIVICCCSLNAESTKMFNLKAFSLMRRTAIFVNVSRGLVVDQEALHTALTQPLIAAAGLDVTHPEPLPLDHPLQKLNNCLIMPHIATATVESREAMADLGVRNVIAGILGQPLPSPVPF